MDETQIYLLLFSANLAFIVTNLYGWVLKEFYMATPYREALDTLFPARRMVGVLYLAQLMEVPYLLMMGQAEALFYINAFSMLFFSSMTVVIGEGYFFHRKYTTKQLIFYFLPVCISVGWLLLAAWGIVPAAPHFYRWMFAIVCLVFFYYMVRVVMVQQKILRKVSEVRAGSGTSDGDFPIQLSLKIRWLLLPVPLLMFGCFLCNDVYVKLGRDVLFTFVNVWFLLYTIKPHRKITGGIVAEEAAKDIQAVVDVVEDGVAKTSSKYKLSPERFLELEQLIKSKLEDEKLFLNPALTIELLAEEVHSNKSYVSETINRGSFGSYYAMINHYRIEYAIEMFKEHPTERIEQISAASGFSSTSVFSQVFKRSKGMTLRQFVQVTSSGAEPQ